MTSTSTPSARNDSAAGKMRLGEGLLQAQQVTV